MEFTQLSPEQILELGKPCDELTQALETKKPTPQLDWSNSQKAVATLRYVVNMMDQRDKPDPDVQEKTVDVPIRDGTAISMKIFQPAQHDDGPRGPLIVLFFAGGFVMGSPSTLGVLARPLVKRFKATVVAPAYRLAPEHPFPIAVHDAWDAVQWVGSNAHSISADPAKGFIVGGISSGALLANVVVHLAKDADAAPKISGAFLCCGSARVAAKDAEKLPESYRQRNLSRSQKECISGPTATPEMSQLSRECNKPDDDSELYAPLLWPSGHERLPKTYSQVCGMEPARDECLIYDDMLKKAGVPTRLDLYRGLPHTFFHNYPELPQSKKWWQDTMDGFTWLMD